MKRLQQNTERHPRVSSTHRLHERCCCLAEWSHNGERSATMASAGPSRHLPVQEPSTRRGGSAALLCSVVNRRDASPRGRGSSQRVRAGSVAAAGANRRRSRKVRCARARLWPGAMWRLWAVPVRSDCAEIFFLAQRSQDNLQLLHLWWSHWVHTSSWGKISF